MKVGAKKCSLKKHTDINAISFCQDCSIYLCNKCQNYHSELFENHKIYPFKGDEENISLDICRVENHSKYKLNYYCKTHKQLVCVACLCKIKDDMNGQHKDCDVCLTQEIKIEKKKRIIRKYQIFGRFIKFFKKFVR
jgi:hypothetical protein